MNKIIVALTIFLAFAGICCSTSKRGLDTAVDRFICYYDTRTNTLGNPLIYLDYAQFFNADEPRVDLYIEIPYSHLHFAIMDRENNLKTEYTIRISINDHEGVVVKKRNVNKQVTTTRNLISRYGASDKTMESFNLPPGEYRVILTLNDLSVQQETEIREVIEVIPFDAEQVNISDLLLLRSVTEDRGRTVITPMLASRVLTLTEPLSVYWEIYSPSSVDSATFTYGLIRNRYNNDILIDTPFSYEIQKTHYRSDIYVERRDTIVLGDTTLTLQEGRNRLFVTFDEVIGRGKYEVFLKEEDKLSRKEFTLFNMDFPHVTDVDEQIEALYYIASNREYNNMKAGETVEERRRRLYEYWERPGMWRMTDYYERVRIANELFTTNIEGWRTPMGMVFIILGDPHFVRCRIGIEQIETWTYHLQTAGLEFVFIRERTADVGDRSAYYWISSIRGGYSAWISALNMWR